MTKNEPSQNPDAVIVIVILFRVFLMLVLWIGVFLAIFLGYFTVPLLLIGIITAVYLISDLGLFVTLKKRVNPLSERQKIIESIKDDSTEKE